MNYRNPKTPPCEFSPLYLS